MFYLFLTMLQCLNAACLSKLTVRRVVHTDSTIYTTTYDITWQWLQQSSLALISILIHTHSYCSSNNLEFSPCLFRSPQTLNTFRKHLKIHFASLLLISPSDLSSASDSFYWINRTMALNQILLLIYSTYLKYIKWQQSLSRHLTVLKGKWKKMNLAPHKHKSFSTCSWNK